MLSRPVQSRAESALRYAVHCNNVGFNKNRHLEVKYDESVGAIHCPPTSPFREGAERASFGVCFLCVFVELDESASGGIVS